MNDTVHFHLSISEGGRVVEEGREGAVGFTKPEKARAGGQKLRQASSGDGGVEAPE